MVNGKELIELRYDYDSEELVFGHSYCERLLSIARIEGLIALSFL